MKSRAVTISISILAGISLTSGRVDLSLPVPVRDWTFEIDGGEYGIQVQVPIGNIILGPDPVLGRQRRYAAVFNSHEWSVSEKTFWLFGGIFLTLITGVTLLREARKSAKRGQVMDQP